jgi:hypothetical protein
MFLTILAYTNIPGKDLNKCAIVVIGPFSAEDTEYLTFAMVGMSAENLPRVES